MLQILSPTQAENEIKKSRFIGQLYPVFSREEAKKILQSIRTQHPQAVHVCWVLLCEGDSGMDDDGEPSGTAAKPMYNVLTHKNVFNVLAVVVRYWGGIKLGAGGLTRAYGQAISDAFKDAQLVPIEVLTELIYSVTFADESQLRRLCEQYNATISQVIYRERAILYMSIKEAQKEAFEIEVSNLLRGNFQKLNIDE